MRFCIIHDSVTQRREGGLERDNVGGAQLAATNGRRPVEKCRRASSTGVNTMA